MPMSPRRLLILSILMLSAVAIAGAPARGGDDARDPFLLAMQTTPATYVDVFPQDMSFYQVGGWSDPVSGDGTGGTVRAGLDAASIYLDGTTNALAYVMRNAPVARDFQMTVNFTIVSEQMTTDDHLAFLLRFKDPVFPASCCFGGSGQVHASSGVMADFNLGRGTLILYKERNDLQASAFAPPTPFSIGFGQPHQIAISFVGGLLGIGLDGTPAGAWRIPNLPAGRVGFEVYRLDLSVTGVTLITQ